VWSGWQSVSRDCVVSSTPNRWINFRLFLCKGAAQAARCDSTPTGGEGAYERHPALVAGPLPPLSESYRGDLLLDAAQMREHPRNPKR